MIKRLRIKFICVLMLIVTIMLGVILGGVIHFAGYIMEMQSISMMQRVASVPFKPGLMGDPTEEGVRLPFFTVQLDAFGKVANTFGGSYDLSDREFLQEIVDAAVEENRDTGKLADFGLRFQKMMPPPGEMGEMGENIVFSDLTTEQITLRNLFYSCLLIGLVAWLIFLALAVLLSHWVIKPVAKAWEQQRQFVADAGHELKTPLSVIMANAELMQNEDYEAEKKKSFAESILSTTYQMRSLVENLLEMARVDNGISKMKFAKVDFSQLVTDAELSFRLLYEEKGMALESAIAEGITIKGSEQHLYQVMDVLLDNALKYSLPESKVLVKLNRTPRGCLLCVSGKGEEMSKETLKNIFKRFYRADKARSHNGSYGLGLSIAESIVRAHRGKIWAESKDGYNSFYVSL